MNFVYLTTNLINGKQYVGSHSSEDINDGYIGSGRYFLRSVKKYGRENFKREILKECENIGEARLLEELYIKEYNTLQPNGYNISPTGGCSHQGGRLSKEHREKIRSSLSGKKYTKERIEKAAKGHIGFKHTEESKDKISKGNKGKIVSEETKERIKRNNIGKHNHQGPWTGKRRDENTKQKIKEALKGQKSPMKGKNHSKKTKEKISESNKGLQTWIGKNHSSESKNMISEKLKGTKQSEETKRKRSESMKKVWLIKNKKMDE